MNIIEKIQKAASENGLTVSLISGERTRLLFGVSPNPKLYKILYLSEGCPDIFRQMCAYLVQNKPNVRFINVNPHMDEYVASFIEGDFKVEIVHHYYRKHITFYKI
jgi:hypothetical protein